MKALKIALKTLRTILLVCSLLAAVTSGCLLDSEGAMFTVALATFAGSMAIIALIGLASGWMEW